MSELYMIHWPQNFTAAYVRGATIQYAKDRSVYYANEVLSPGQIICTWASMTDYLSSGNVPSLPLLKNGKTYFLDMKLAADNDLPVQIQINFWDANHDLLASYQGTEKHLTFTVPKGMVSYEIHLVNLKHKWLRFEMLTISENKVVDRITDTEFSQHYAWIDIQPVRETNFETVRLIVNKGPSGILPISVDESIDSRQVIVYTDGQEVNALIKSLSQVIQFKPDVKLNIEAGLSYYHFSSEFIFNLEEGLEQVKVLGGINHDELDY